jgi:hypothetical protein
MKLDTLDEVVFLDFEFHAPRGEVAAPLCVCWYELRSGRAGRLWLGDHAPAHPPFANGDHVLFVAFYASADIGCFVVLDWPVPTNVLDLFVEHRNFTNGLHPAVGAELADAVAFHGLQPINPVTKAQMQALAQRGGPFSELEKKDLMTSCASDVTALRDLFIALASTIDLDLALLRGRYMKAAAHVERVGVPIDTIAYSKLRERWEDLAPMLIDEIDHQYGVYDGNSFSVARWAVWCDAHGIDWPRLDSGALSLDADTFKDMANVYPSVAPMKELRATLGKLRLRGLAVGGDGRNRTQLSAFGTITGRNAPSTNEFIFGPAVCMRKLIRPVPGMALAYLDWVQQEFGVAAILSGDPAMLAAYQSGDTYIAFGQQAGVIPPGATKHSHPVEREKFKQCVLAVQYGMGARALGTRIGASTAHGQHLLDLHRRTYPRFWRWSEDATDRARFTGAMTTTFGWRLLVGDHSKSTTLANWPMQANAAEMLRLAIIIATEKGVHVNAPVHDALLFEAPAAKLDHQVALVRAAMDEASEWILDGFKLRTDLSVIRYPDRFSDPRGRDREMWATFCRLIDGLEPVHPCTKTCSPVNHHLSTGEHPSLSYLSGGSL